MLFVLCLGLLSPVSFPCLSALFRLILGSEQDGPLVGERGKRNEIAQRPVACPTPDSASVLFSRAGGLGMSTGRVSAQ